MARNPGSSDGSAPVIGDLPTGTSGSRPRTPRRGDQVAGVALDGTRSPEMAARNAEALMAQALVNSGAADSDGAGPVPGLGAPWGPGSSSGNTWSDPSSQRAQG
jgi:hypothetical protein